MGIEFGDSLGLAAPVADILRELKNGDPNEFENTIHF